MSSGAAEMKISLARYCGSQMLPPGKISHAQACSRDIRVPLRVFRRPMRAPESLGSVGPQQQPRTPGFQPFWGRGGGGGTSWEICSCACFFSTTVHMSPRRRSRTIALPIVRCLVFPGSTAVPTRSGAGNVESSFRSCAWTPRSLPQAVLQASGSNTWMAFGDSTITPRHARQAVDHLRPSAIAALCTNTVV